MNVYWALSMHKTLIFVKWEKWMVDRNVLASDQEDFLNFLAL